MIGAYRAMLDGDVGRSQQLYRALSEDGNPTLDTLTRVVRALGFRLSVVREGDPPPPPPAAAPPP